MSVSIKDEPGIVIDGGKGVGRVTKPGLDRAIGEAAINSVPRKMIEDNLLEVLKDRNMENTGLEVIVSVPGGEKIAEKTFNPKLGIVGGISILGTTGIVEPMSEKAIVDTIRTEIRVRKAEGRQVLLAAPGNYGITFLSEKCGIDKDIAVNGLLACVERIIGKESIEIGVCDIAVHRVIFFIARTGQIQIIFGQFIPIVLVLTNDITCNSYPISVFTDGE